MALSVQLTPGYTFTTGELITEDKLNALGNPAVQLEGAISSASIADGSVTAPKLAADAVTTPAITPGAVTPACLSQPNAGGPNSGVKAAYASTTTVSYSATQLIVGNGSGSTFALAGISGTVAIGASGLNGLDTGTIAASTWYYLYVVWNGSASGGILSLSATAPTLPSGYTSYALVAPVWINSSTNVALFNLMGNRVYTPPQAVISGAIANGTYTSHSLSAIVPPNATEVAGTMGFVGWVSNVGGVIMVAADAGGTGQQTWASFANSSVGYSSGGEITAGAPYRCPLTTAQTLYVKSLGAGGGISFEMTISSYTI